MAQEKSISVKLWVFCLLLDYDDVCGIILCRFYHCYVIIKTYMSRTTFPWGGECVTLGINISIAPCYADSWFRLETRFRIFHPQNFIYMLHWVSIYRKRLLKVECFHSLWTEGIVLTHLLTVGVAWIFVCHFSAIYSCMTGRSGWSCQWKLVNRILTVEVSYLCLFDVLLFCLYCRGILLTVSLAIYWYILQIDFGCIGNRTW